MSTAKWALIIVAKFVKRHWNAGTNAKKSAMSLENALFQERIFWKKVVVKGAAKNAQSAATDARAHAILNSHAPKPLVKLR